MSPASVFGFLSSKPLAVRYPVFHGHQWPDSREQRFLFFQPLRSCMQLSSPLSPVFKSFRVNFPSLIQRSSRAPPLTGRTRFLCFPSRLIFPLRPCQILVGLLLFIRDTAPPWPYLYEVSFSFPNELFCLSYCRVISYSFTFENDAFCCTQSTLFFAV